MKDYFKKRIEKAVVSIRKYCREEPETGIILGSGLNEFVDTKVGVEIPFSKIREFPMSGTKSHRGLLKVGKKLLIFAGRFHLYEGLEMDDIVLPVFIFKALGGKNLIVTNAAGGVNEEYMPGDLVCIKDHINLMGQSPLRGRNDDRLGPRFPDIKSAYTRELIDVAKNQGVCELKEGIYAAVQGPNYETCAEANMLRTIGADMVGMSTVPEVIAAAYIGLRVLGISCISNKVGVIEEPVSHEEVIMTGKKVSERFSALLDHILSKI